MATTTNYGWQTPDDSALVKDGASAIRTLGSSIDTTTKNLNPETTLGDISYRSSTSNVNTRLPLGTAGQVLKVNSGATAPEWSSDNAGMTNPMTTTGDTIYSSSGTTPARLGIGTTGQVLTVAAGLPSWATPTAAGANWTLLNAGGTALTGAATITVSGISGADKIAIFIDTASSASASSVFSIRFNTSSASNYNYFGMGSTYRSTYDNFVFRAFAATNQDSIVIGEMSGSASSALGGYMIITGCNSSGNKVYNAQTGVSPGGNTGNQGYGIGGYWNNSAAITSVSIISGTGNFDDGNIRVYTSA